MSTHIPQSRLALHKGAEGPKVPSGEKWWIALVLGCVFAVLASPPAFYLTSAPLEAVGAMPTLLGPGPTAPGLVIHAMLFALVVRLLLR